MNVNDDGICQRCRKPGKENLFTRHNRLDPGLSIQQLAVLHGLPVPEQLSQIEEMMLSPVQVVMQAYTIRGGQHKYAGHCCNFIRDTASFINKLPRLPEHLDIIIIRPKSNDSVAEQVISHQLTDAFQFKRSRYMANLHVLQRCHPSFQNATFQLDEAALDSLPEDGSVLHRLHSVNDDTSTTPGQMNENQGPDVASGEEEEQENHNMISTGFVPSLMPEEREIVQMWDQLQPVEVTLTQPQIRGTPINEHDPNIRSLIDGYPVLFPTGQADIHDDRPIGKVSPEQYFRHLMRWHDGRFARHPRFRYLALNSIMRWSGKTQARCYASRNHRDGKMTCGILSSIYKLTHRGIKGAS